ncbi:MAG: hypothetical protein JRN37_05870 [Nitrososphaerota archaeon]|nr:hypothetical protein [Nitrososphaerota archaeon]MDG7041395.1 hypothetical protein [Nitrososphaerota archaeon]MDG7043641.1 hypothetical protein [Nitrososphaerota archaeon]
MRAHAGPGEVFSGLQLKLAAGNDYLNITNTGFAPVTISSIVVNHDNALSFYNYSAMILPEQRVSLYVSFAPGDRVGVETSGGAVWAPTYSCNG